MGFPAAILTIFMKCSVGNLKCSSGNGEEFMWVVKWGEVKGWGESESTGCVGKYTGNCIQHFLTVGMFTFCTCCILRCLMCIVVSCFVCIVVVVLCVLLLVVLCVLL